MINAFCPRCSEVQDLTETVEMRSKKDEKGNEIEIMEKIYHCVKCNTFVYSESFPTESTDEEEGAE
jgi:hypothetical protein